MEEKKWEGLCSCTIQRSAGNPNKEVYDDGIFEIRRGVYSKTFKFTDINFATASEEGKDTMVKGYGEVKKSFDPSATTRITINNRKLNKLDFEENILLKLQGDELDVYREEYNQMLTEKESMTNSIIQDKYITATIESKSIEEVRTFIKNSIWSCCIRKPSHSDVVP